MKIYETLSNTAPPPINIEALIKWISYSDPFPENALEKIDRVRFLWEERKLSFDLHTLRATLFEQKKQWSEALNSFEDALHYAEAVEEKPLRERAQKIFVDQFIHNKNFSPLQALAFYERFRKFAPYHDPEKRYALNDRLMDLLVRLDLLDQAFLIGQQNIKKFRDIETKKAISLYLTFLLIEDEEAEKALEKLKKIEEGPLNEEMQRQVSHLKAHAYQKLEQYEEMLPLLEEQTDLESKLLKLNAYWGLKNWELAAPLAKNVLTLLNSNASGTETTEADIETTLKKTTENLIQGSYTHQHSIASLLTQKELKKSLLSALYLSGKKENIPSEKTTSNANNALFSLLSSRASALTVPPKEILRNNLTNILQQTSQFIETFEKELNTLSQN